MKEKVFYKHIEYECWLSQLEELPKSLEGYSPHEVLEMYLDGEIYAELMPSEIESAEKVLEILQQFYEELIKEKPDGHLALKRRIYVEMDDNTEDFIQLPLNVHYDEIKLEVLEKLEDVLVESGLNDDLSYDEEEKDEGSGIFVKDPRLLKDEPN